MCQSIFAWFEHTDSTAITNCTASSTESVWVQLYVTFTSAEVGKSYYARMMLKQPDGNFYVYYTASQNVTVAGAGYHFYTPALPISTLTGVWSTYGFEIYTDTSPPVLTCGPVSGTGSGSCESITVTGGGGTCSAPSACSVTGPTTVTQGASATYTCNWTGSGTYNVDFYKDGAYWKSVTNVTGTTASITQTMDATTFPSGTHTIAANSYCVSNTGLSCATTVISVNVVSSCATPSISLSMT